MMKDFFTSYFNSMAKEAGVINEFVNLLQQEAEKAKKVQEVNKEKVETKESESKDESKKVNIELTTGELSNLITACSITNATIQAELDSWVSDTIFLSPIYKKEMDMVENLKSKLVVIYNSVEE